MSEDYFINRWREMASTFSHTFSVSESSFKNEYEVVKASYNPESLEINIKLAYLAIGLLTYGDLRGTLDLFDNLPLPPVTHEGTLYKFLGEFIQIIFPLPSYMKESDSFAMRGHTNLLRLWFEENHKQLIWNSETNRFEIAYKTNTVIGRKVVVDLLPIFRTEAQSVRHWACYIVGHTNIRESKQGEYLISRYPEIKQRTDHLLYEQQVEDVGMGILASGHINILDEIIDIINIRSIKLIPSFLPLPASMQNANYLNDHRDELKEWIARNKENLTWNGTTEKFVYKE